MKNKVELAQELAKQIHTERPRLSGESYYQHVQETANYLTEIGIDDENILILAYLSF
ncbi:MAG TPA: hypothetical protein VLI92_00675 [Candidatus Saccharimonadales bacterium]|nr:hypothetical protein [Candidatus Saccharimonadales bacterium]